MIESYQIKSSTEKILSRFSISLNEYTLPINVPYTVEKGAMGYVITSENERELRRIKFGLTPYWSKKPMDILTARAEGDKNMDNDPCYSGPNQIFLKPAFKKAIQNYRCLVVADQYTEFSLKQPLEIALSENNFPVVFAGIYDYWQDPETKIIQPGFAIITIPATGILQEIGVKRMPVILSYFNCINWIRSPKSLNFYLPMLDQGSSEFINVSSLNHEGKEQKVNKSDENISPLPKRYHSKKYNRSDNNLPTWGEMRMRQNQSLP